MSTAPAPRSAAPASGCAPVAAPVVGTARACAGWRGGGAGAAHAGGGEPGLDVVAGVAPAGPDEDVGGQVGGAAAVRGGAGGGGAGTRGGGAGALATVVSDAPLGGGIDTGTAGAGGAGAAAFTGGAPVGGGIAWTGPAKARACNAAWGRPPAWAVVTSAPPPSTAAAATLSRVPPVAESTAPAPMQTPRGASGRCRRERLSPCVIFPSLSGETCAGMWGLRR